MSIGMTWCKERDCFMRNLQMFPLLEMSLDIYKDKLVRGKETIMVNGYSIGKMVIYNFIDTTKTAKQKVNGYGIMKMVS